MKKENLKKSQHFTLELFISFFLVYLGTQRNKQNLLQISLKLLI